ncbi:high-affinity branched-chain amino acid ABC transporter ATP-binding protein LivG [Oceanisphaera avium]|uniref:High-affinity branched-chain amino acid ABC transporter ATP-binding protein LivG n=1 Tax=Oceanisphaera avium TaxID=1903694 RepID=A0A1Y0CYC7_9GAMM|nr:high-affinity branched-chain amino acid ABC transporter ATP-binding protein LivG [Oceanisphaera avium]ART80323.1 high-affinity branched-chain amino acid ABC transporter ATP-binding protein LivG [Oceanisphaera avium]
MSALLQVSDLSMRFGGLVAVDNVALTVKPQQVVSIIGPNGAGKTTIFNCLSGFYRASGGQVRFKEQLISGMPGFKIARLGMVRTFQHVRLFKEMTVLENLLVAQHRHLNTHFLAGLFKTPAFRRAERQGLELAHYWLEKVQLTCVANRSADNLSYGQQRRLEIARCMATRPQLLMLDEPAAGLNPNETHELNHLICDLRDNEGVSILLIEHDMKLVMGISDYIYVVNQGRPLAQGTSEQVRSNKDVINAYLGDVEHH